MTQDTKNLPPRDLSAMVAQENKDVENILSKPVSKTIHIPGNLAIKLKALTQIEAKNGTGKDGGDIIIDAIDFYFKRPEIRDKIIAMLTLLGA